MSNSEREIILIGASPKIAEPAISEWLASLAEVRMNAGDLRVQRVRVRDSFAKKRTEADFEAMLRADALVVIFPLYIFCLPGMLMRYLQDFHAYRAGRAGGARGQKVYAVVNCGFPEPEINLEAVRVMERFSEAIGARFRFGVMLGAGPMIMAAGGAPFLKRIRLALDGAFDRMARDVLSDDPEPTENVRITARFPRKLYYFMGGQGWVYAARKNGLKRKDLYRRPYLE